MTKLTAADGHTFDLYEVRPDDAAAAIVVIQEIFGVNEHIRSVVDRYAAFGYHAVAPALFDRGKPGVELDYDSGGIAQGRGMADAIKWEPAMHDLAATVAHVAAAQGRSAPSVTASAAASPGWRQRAAGRRRRSATTAGRSTR